MTAATLRIPEGRRSPAPGPRVSLVHKGQPALAHRSWPQGFPRRNSSRWRRPLESAGQRWPRRRPWRPAGEPSWDEHWREEGREGTLKIPGGRRQGVGGRRGGGQSPRACELYWVEKSLLLSPPPCVRSCALRAPLLESRLRSCPSALLTAPDTPRQRRGRRPRAGADRHHPPRRTHSRARLGRHPKAGSGLALLSEWGLLSKGKPKALGPR